MDVVGLGIGLSSSGSFRFDGLFGRRQQGSDNRFRTRGPDRGHLLLRAGLDPVLYMGSKYGGQLMVTSDVENFPGFKDPVSGPDLMEQMRAQAERVGTRLDPGRRHRGRLPHVSVRDQDAQRGEAGA